MESIGLSTYRWNNNIKSVLLLAVFPCLLLGLVAAFFTFTGMAASDPQGSVDLGFAQSMGYAVTPSLTGLTPLDFALDRTQAIAPFVFLLAGVWIVIGMWFNEGIVRLSTNARPVERNENPTLYNLLENLCIARGLRMPKLYMIDTPVMNAYASGLTESSFAVTVTRGLTEKLSKDELEAVLAHELSHIMNRDVRLLVMTLLFGGMLSFFAEMAWRSMRHMPISSGNSNRRNGSGAILLIAAIVLIVGYGMACLFRLALSRRREYLADAGAVALTKRPDSLIRALEKIAGNAAMPDIPSGVQAMLIESPPEAFSLLATHPPIAARIAVLRRLGGLPAEGDSIIPKAG